jgi:hypothetical protein
VSDNQFREASTQPAGFVRVFDRRLAGLRHQLFGYAGTMPRHPGENLYQVPRAQARLFADSAQGNTLELRHGGRRRDELIAIETLGQNRGGPGLEGASAPRAIVLRQPIELSFGLHWVAFQDQSAVSLLLLQGMVKGGTAVVDLGRNVDDPLGLACIEGPALGSWIPRPGAFGLGDLGESCWL